MLSSLILNVAIVHAHIEKSFQASTKFPAKYHRLKLGSIPNYRKQQSIPNYRKQQYVNLEVFAW